MLYDYQYDVVSIIAVCFLLAIYVSRRTYKTKSNTILLLLLVCDLFGASFDVASIFSISFPERYPMWINYFTTLGNIFFYNMMGVLFFGYIDSRAKIAPMWKTTKWIVAVVVAFESILIFLSPITHWVIYYDETGCYQHGPYMVVLYVIAAGLLFGAAVMFVIERRRFNRYQVVAICAFIVAVFAGVLVQLMIPRMLVGQLGCTLVLYFIYTSLENPVYYTYQSTTCYNRTAFLETLKKKKCSQESIHLLAFCIRDYEYIRGNLSLKNLERLSCKIAEHVHGEYGSQAFCVSDDKFVIFLEDEFDVVSIRQELESYFLNAFNLVDMSLTISIDVVCVMDVDCSLKIDLIENGITYLLEQNTTINGTEAFAEVVQKIKRRKAISHIVKEAIEEKRIDVYYQPIRNVRTGKYSCVEALARLYDKDFGFISPDEFIPIAESEGAILKIGELVFEKVCRFIHTSNCIEEMGVDYVEVNLSPLQCFQADIVERFSNLMEQYEVNPKWINLEITESAQFEKDNLMEKNINLFHEMGITFSLDDYGSGFASVDYLFKLPVNIVKIDKSILWQAMKDRNAKTVLTSTLHMIHNLGKHVVVEGVEDEEMVKLLEMNECGFMQGYYYSKPLPEQQYVEFLKSNI